MGRWLVVLAVLVGCEVEPLPPLRVGTACPAVVMREVNDHWIATHADPGDNDWRRATYFVGDVEAARALADPSYLAYARGWAAGHHYKIHDGVGTRNADNHCAGQVYLALYDEERDPTMIANIIASIERVVDSGERDDWSWIDAQFMASPVYAQLAAVTGHPYYADAMFELYTDARDRRRLFDQASGLWFRDGNYLYPDARTDDGARIFWSRGNGWVIASVVRTLAQLPDDSPYRSAYVEMLQAMAAALESRQREDGLWNVSLDDASDHGGPEASGTAFFTYGIAWGIDHPILDRDRYAPIVERAWQGLVATAVRADGELGLVQGVGEAPESSQPVTLASTADYGVGAFLLAGSEVSALGLDLGCEP